MIKLQKIQNGKMEKNIEEAKENLDLYINEVLDPFYH